MQIKSGNADMMWRGSIWTTAGDLCQLGLPGEVLMSVVSASDLGKGMFLKENSVKLIKQAREGPQWQHYEENFIYVRQEVCQKLS